PITPHPYVESSLSSPSPRNSNLAGLFYFSQILPLPPLTVSLPTLPAPFLLLFHTSTPKTTFPSPSLTQISSFTSFLTPNMPFPMRHLKSYLHALQHFLAYD